MRTELTDPRRTLTSTVKLAGAKDDLYLPVKTTGGMEQLEQIPVSVPVVRGDVICRDFLGEGVDLVAGKTVRA